MDDDALAHVDNDVPCIRMEGWKVAGGLPLSLASGPKVMMILLCSYLCWSVWMNGTGK